MRNCAWSICRLILCGLVGCCLVAPWALAAEKPQTQAAKTDPAMDDQMAAYIKFATPTAEHERLKALAGTWKTVTRAWTGPGDPEVSEGTAVKSMILGDRFLKEEFDGTFMEGPFQGMGLTGYDTMKQEYVGTWVDTMGTGIVRSTGRYDSSAKQFNYSAVYTDPTTLKDRSWRMVNKVVDANSHVLSMFDMLDGKEVLTMEITYTRK